MSKLDQARKAVETIEQIRTLADELDNNDWISNEGLWEDCRLWGHMDRTLALARTRLHNLEFRNFAQHQPAVAP